MRKLSLGLLTVFAITGMNAPAYSTNPRDHERVWLGRNSPDGKAELWVLRSEEKHWWVDHLLIRPGRLQQLVERLEMPSASVALKYIQAKLPPEEMRDHASAIKKLRESWVETESPGDVLWPVTQSWNEEWEQRFSQWIADEFQRDFFMKHHMATDCADVAYAVRWIFARIHGLPAANRLSGSSVFFSQDSMKAEWLNLPKAEVWYEDQRFRAALDYLFEHTYTGSIEDDSYPIKIDSQSFTLGLTFLRMDGHNHHTRIFSEKRVYSDQNVDLVFLASNLPKRERYLIQDGLWMNQQPRPGQGGFLKFRWPEFQGGKWRLRAARQHRDYSEEQYAPHFVPPGRPFDEAVLMRLTPAFDLRKRLESGLERLELMLAERVRVVDEGARICREQECVPGSSPYEDWSTPSRDAQLLEQYRELESLVQGSKGSRSHSVLLALWKTVLHQTLPLRVGEGASQIGVVMAGLLRGDASSDPRHSIEERWGFNPERSAEYFHHVLGDLLARREEGLVRNVDVKPLEKSLRERALQMGSYCVWALSDTACALFEEELNQRRLSRGGEDLSLAEWKQRLPFLGLATRAEDPWAHRAVEVFSGVELWGELEEITSAGTSQWLSAAHTQGIRRSDAHAWRGFSTRGTFESEVLPHPWDPDEGWAAEFSKDVEGVIAWRLASVEQERFVQTLEKQLVRAEWVAPGVLSAIYQADEERRQYFYHFLPDVEEMRVWGPYVISSDRDKAEFLAPGMLWVRSGNVVRILHFERGRGGSETIVKWPEEMADLSAVPGWRTDSGALFWARECSGEKSTTCLPALYRFDDRAGSISRVALPRDLNDVSSVLDRRLFVLKDSPHQFVMFQSDRTTWGGDRAQLWQLEFRGEALRARVMGRDLFPDPQFLGEAWVSAGNSEKLLVFRSEASASQQRLFRMTSREVHEIELPRPVVKVEENLFVTGSARQGFWVHSTQNPEAPLRGEHVTLFPGGWFILSGQNEQRLYASQGDWGRELLHWQGQLPEDEEILAPYRRGLWKLPNSQVALPWADGAILKLPLFF